MNAVYPTKLRCPYLVVINVTRRCNLSCAYCYLDATQRWKPQSDELGQRDLAPVLAELGLHAPGTIVVLTGGEPLLHGEIEPMVEAGVEADLRVVLGTNGVLLSEARIKRFKALGLAGVGISGEFLGVLPDPLPGLPRGGRSGQRLARVPEFVRPMVRDSVERHARERGCREVTCEVMDEVKSSMRM